MKRNLSFAHLVLLVYLTAASTGAQPQQPQPQQQRGMTPADTLRIANVGDPQISPDGGWVVYTLSSIEGNNTRTTLMWARLNNPATLEERDLTRPLSRPAPELLLPAGWSGSHPRWSPDGKRLAFLATRDKQSGIWVVTPAERQPRFVAPVRATNFHIAYAGESFTWSPDSRRIAFISATEETAAAGSDAGRDDPRVIDRIQYKSRTSFSDRARTHVWVVEVAPESSVEEHRARQLTTGQFYDHALAWSPRGDEVAFLSNREPDPDAFNNSDIYTVDMTGRVRQLTSTRGCEYEPQWSPDGKWIAYTATKRDVTTIDSVAEDAHVWIIDSSGGGARELSQRLDRRARSPRWSFDSKSIYFLAGDRGRTLIYRIGIDEAQARAVLLDDKTPSDLRAVEPSPRLVQPFQVSGFSISTGVRSIERPLGGAGSPRPVIAYTGSGPTRPMEVWIAFPGLQRAPTWQISRHNTEFARTLALSEPEEINFRSFDGTPVQGWLLKPPGWRADRRYPLILSVHGGPHGMYGYGFNATFQTFAARGYAVLYLNPRGSSGYGQKFSDGTLREWGGGDYRDLMLGVDEALRTRSWIDPEKLGVTGGSYGGFMTNWIITQTTRFKAAVAQASVSNLVSFYSTSLYQDLIHAEFGGFPWDDYDQLWRWSPLRYVRQAQTPTLLIHGEQDNDVHITQAEEMYMALKRRGVETVMVRYPREGHGFREPLHRQDALERTLSWFDRFLK
jgi:dipeptidyl aminopeptidase/acylaminoacyl peptidase